MAKVKMPLLSVEARGKISGLVYNTWRGQNYVKTNTSPTGQGTELRLLAQARITTVSKLWQALSNEVRLAWNQYAIDHPIADWTGAPLRLTGQNWFIRCNINLLRMNVAAITDPPENPQPDAPTGLVISYASETIQGEWTTPTDAVTKLEIWIAGPLSPGVTPKIQQAHFLGDVFSNSPQPINILATTAAGRYTIWGRIQDMVEGLCSPWASGYVDVT